MPGPHTNREEGYRQAIHAAMSIVSTSYQYQPNMSDAERLADWTSRLRKKYQKSSKPINEGYNAGLDAALAVFARFEEGNK